MPTPEERGTRKLAAIMFTDMKDFSRKMQENENAAFEILRTHDSMLRNIVLKNGGRIIKSVGDAFMVDFSSAVNAVSCAVRVQEKLWDYNKDKSDFNKIEVRIGIHLGDVIDVGTDMYGDGVNIAARIESITEPNRICVSQDIYNQIKNKLSIKAARIGEVALKNIKEPIEVYEILLDSIPELSTPSKKALEADAMRRAEAASLKEAEEAKQIEAARRKKDEELGAKANEHFQRAEELFDRGKLDEAEEAIQEVFKLIALHGGAQSLQLKIDAVRFQREEEQRLKRAEEARKEIQRREKQIQEILERAENLSNDNRLGEALIAIQEALALDANHPATLELELRINQAALELAQEQTAVDTAAETATQEEVSVEPRQTTRPKPSRFRYRRQRQTPWGKIIGGIIFAGLIVAGLSYYDEINGILFPKTASLIVLVGDSGRLSENHLHYGAAFSCLLTDALGTQRNLSVISSSSALFARTRSLSSAQIQKEFGVQYMLLLQFESQDNKILLRASLTDLQSQQRAWNSTYDFTPRGSTALQEKIVSQVLDAVGVLGSELPSTSFTNKALAAELLLQAIPLLEQRQLSSIQKGIELLQEALQEDNAFTMAAAHLSNAYLTQFELGGETDRNLLSQASQYAQTALRQDPQQPLANAVMGTVLVHNQRFAEASQFLEIALDEFPNQAAAYRQSALIQVAGGAYSRAGQLANQALRLDPKHPNSHLVRGIVYHFNKEYSAAAHHYDTTIALGADPAIVTHRYRMSAWVAQNMLDRVTTYGEAVVERDPSNYRVYYWIGRALQLGGKAFESKPYLDRGLEVAKERLEEQPRDWIALSYVGLLYSRTGRFEEGSKALDEAFAINPKAAQVLYRRASLFAVQNKKAETFEWLKKAVEMEFLPWEVLSPDFLLYSRDPEYNKAIIRNIK